MQDVVRVVDNDPGISLPIPLAVDHTNAKEVQMLEGLGPFS